MKGLGNVAGNRLELDDTTHFAAVRNSGGPHRRSLIEKSGLLQTPEIHDVVTVRNLLAYKCFKPILDRVRGILSVSVDKQKRPAREINRAALCRRTQLVEGKS